MNNIKLIEKSEHFLKNNKWYKLGREHDLMLLCKSLTKQLKQVEVERNTKSTSLLIVNGEVYPVVSFELNKELEIICTMGEYELGQIQNNTLNLGKAVLETTTINPFGETSVHNLHINNLIFNWYNISGSIIKVGFKSKFRKKHVKCK